MSGTSGGLRMYFAVVGVVVGLDQITKALVDRFMALYESRPIVDGLLRLTYVQNRGAAFGIFSDADLPAWVLAVVSLCALGAIVVYASKLPAASFGPRLALALIMGGAVGNLLDRMRLGHVIDFVDVYWGAHHWPAFNVADSAISVGVVLLLLDILRHPQGDARTEASAAGPGE